MDKKPQERIEELELLREAIIFIAENTMELSDSSSWDDALKVDHSLNNILELCEEDYRANKNPILGRCVKSRSFTANKNPVDQNDERG